MKFRTVSRKLMLFVSPALIIFFGITWLYKRARAKRVSRLTISLGLLILAN